MKVVGIGLNKTGTKTLRGCLYFKRVKIGLIERAEYHSRL